MNFNMNVVEAREIERQTVETVGQANPSRIQRPAIPDPDAILERIGVTFLVPDRVSGYIRLYPQDFLVEEITPKGDVVELAHDPKFEDSDDKRTLWADMIKCQLSGPNAVQELQALFDLNQTQVGAAGIKDAVAITAQRVSLRGITTEALAAVEHPQMILRPVSYGSGFLQIGELKGNRFTIIIRGKAGESSALIQRALENVKADGFLNFFGPQRFGSRINVHHLGQRLVRGNVQDALRNYLGEAGPFDIPLYRDLRTNLYDMYGDWDQMLELAGHFPFTLKDETKVLRALQTDPQKTRNALFQVKEQVRLWVYAYGSWLMNRAISRAIKNNQSLPAELPLPFSPKGPLPIYKDFMAEDGTLNYLQTLSQYSFINLSDKTIPAVIRPEGLELKEIPQGWIVRFKLSKGAYATSLLSHLIRMHEGLPIPAWVQDQEIDALKVMGDGSLDEIRKKFNKFMVRRDLSPLDAQAAKEAE